MEVFAVKSGNIALSEFYASFSFSFRRGLLTVRIHLAPYADVAEVRELDQEMMVLSSAGGQEEM